MCCRDEAHIQVHGVEGKFKFFHTWLEAFDAWFQICDAGEVHIIKKLGSLPSQQELDLCGKCICPDE